MDLDYGSEMEGFREEVRSFVETHWPLSGEEAEWSLEKQASTFRERAIEQGYLYRNIPRKYGGSEQDPPLVFINPEVLELGDEKETAEEGCLSFPDIYVPIPRSVFACFRATDLEGNRFEMEGEGLFARAMQHEFDHLNGQLIADFVGRIKRQFIKRKLARSAQ